MTALLVTVLVASLVGSLHCAGMCGAFVLFAIGAGDPGARARRGWLLGMYQAGRLVTYTGLGAVAGGLGAGIDFGGHMIGLQRAAAILSGVLMVGFGAITLLRLRGVKITALKVPTVLTGVLTAGQRRAMRYSPPVRALVTGLLTTLLPCGFLYSFVIVAAGYGHVAAGALIMGVFWLGTLPMLTVVGAGVRWLAAPLAARLPAITAGMIVVVGVYTIVARAGITLHGSATLSGAAELADQLRASQHVTPACCATKPAASSNVDPAKAGTPNAEVAP